MYSQFINKYYTNISINIIHIYEYIYECINNGNIHARQNNTMRANVAYYLRTKYTDIYGSDLQPLSD